MKRSRCIAGWVTAVLLVMSLLLNVHHYIHESDGQASDTVRVTVVDTLLYYKPAPKAEKVVGRVTHRLPLAEPEERCPTPLKNIPTPDNTGMGNVPKFEKGCSQDEGNKVHIRLDSVNVEIPISTKVYEDSFYRAVISGYGVSLDEMLVFPRREVVTIKPTTTKPKRWSVGIQVGYGITFRGRPQFAPYLGIGIQYNLFVF